MKAQTFVLPWPPSVNSIWRAAGYRNGVIKSETYRNWQEEAGKALAMQKPKSIKGPVRITIGLSSPFKRLWDPDGRVKALFDLLVTHLVIEDDNKDIIREHTVIVDPPGVMGAQITISQVST